MKEVKNLFKDKNKLSKILFGMILVCTVFFMSDLTALATQNSDYGYGYDSTGTYGYGYGYWTEATPTLAISYASCTSSCTITPSTYITITATFGSAATGTPQIQVTEDGVTTQAYTEMSGSSTTWTYGYTTGTGAATAGVVAIRTLQGEAYTPTPSNSTFTITSSGGNSGSSSGSSSNYNSTIDNNANTPISPTTNVTPGATNFVPVKPTTINVKNEAEGLEHLISILGTVPTGNQWQAVDFIAYGTSASNKLSVRDRKGVIGDYYDIYGKVPSSEADWKDIELILTSHKPLQRQISQEKQALVDFAKVYKRMPDFNNIYDEWAMYYIAYNVRNVVRNLDSERAAIGTFKSVYKVVPSTSHQWSIMRAIAYTGAKR